MEYEAYSPALGRLIGWYERGWFVVLTGDDEIQCFDLYDAEDQFGVTFKGID